ncbi:hypothetical protein LTR04_002589 [Oleoguttula sp. CCFEE 6159]|nr:hypothetical protein LTR04_002589 [Oleoguttula sp. CCFEE 6159]
MRANRRLHDIAANVLYGFNTFVFHSSVRGGRFASTPWESYQPVQRLLPFPPSFHLCGPLTANTAKFLRQCEMRLSLTDFSTRGICSKYCKLNQWLTDFATMLGTDYKLNRLEVFFVDSCAAHLLGKESRGPVSTMPPALECTCHQFVLEPLARLFNIPTVAIHGDIALIFRTKLTSLMTAKESNAPAPLKELKVEVKRSVFGSAKRRKVWVPARKYSEAKLDWDSLRVDTRNGEAPLGGTAE